jgi:hypothetical protein
MLALKAKFDGKQIILPKKAKGLNAGEVVVIFDAPEKDQIRSNWNKMQEKALAKAWENAEDAAYDDL